MNADKEILEFSLKAMTDTLERLVGACIGADGKPKAPDAATLAKARACLPKGRENAFSK